MPKHSESTEAFTNLELQNQDLNKASVPSFQLSQLSEVEVENSIKENDDLFTNDDENKFGKIIIEGRRKIFSIFKMRYFNWILLVLVLIAYIIYFCFAMAYHPPFSFPKGANSTYTLDNYIFSNNPGLALFIITVIAVLLILWDSTKAYLERSHGLKHRIPKIKFHPKLLLIYPWIVIGLVAAACIAFLIYDLKEPKNLISLVGLFTFILICILISETPSRINWRALVVGILLQYILGVFILRLEFGFKLFQYLGGQVSMFLDYTDNGSKLVFGSSFADHFFAFKVMPVIIFFSAIVNVLYYFGAVQYVFLKVGWVINKLMSTSPTESVNSVANIFLGAGEAPVLIKPLLPVMTASEIFAVMTAGFSTVSGSTLAAYIGFGVPADHLLTAGLMSSPASLAIAKTILPETKKTKADWDAIRNVPKKHVNNIFEAVSLGAVSMVKTVGAIVANLIAFVSIFAFLDATCIWLFALVNVPNFGLASILQYLFWPFAFLMGVESEDCSSVAKLVGFKVFLNEFYAFTKLGSTINFRNEIIANGTYGAYRNGTLPIPSDLIMIWNARSILISTYALCGFANFGTIGIEIAVLSSFAPSQLKTIVKYAGLAMIAGNFSSFMNACIAGLLYRKT